MDFIKLFDQTKMSFAEHQSKGNRYNYPSSLKQDAVSLLKYYPAQVLSREFGISTKSLRNWQDATGKPVKSSKKAAAFIPITLGDAPTATESMGLLSDHLILKLPHNLELILPIQSVKGAAQFLCDFIKEFSRCSI